MKVRSLFGSLSPAAWVEFREGLERIRWASQRAARRAQKSVAILRGARRFAGNAGRLTIADFAPLDAYGLSHAGAAAMPTWF